MCEYALDMRWMCVGYALDMRWICVGHALDMREIVCVGHA